jgi:hypothetical protein
MPKGMLSAVRIELPGSMVGNKTTMYEAFKSLGVEYGDEEAYAIELLKLLPQSLKEASVWFDNLARLWRYEYGLPIDRMPDDMVVIGTHMYLPVAELYCSLRIANKRLTRVQLVEFLERLSDKRKHTDVLFEMRPLKDVKAALSAAYEVSGLGLGNTHCDWQVKGKLINVVFDVKNRSKSLVEHLKQLIPDLNKGTGQILPTAPNPEDLFKSVEHKLSERCYVLQLQGVWIHSEIKEDETKLRTYFNNVLNKKKVHFAVLSDWKNDAYVLSRNRIVTYILKRIFRLTESERFVSNDYP